ncbi:type II toxin-antitoxin system VapC family toxin [Novosphingobium sp. Fuku2-ISO-50]|uniref:type II toxin-antitoxin system VapC family toxin n=1 Tax=Novosphingobium sp. Fuku2-ISO-50 TaxID=1739114 RepID=UPI0009EAA86B|nr:hypothetical protein [Novosphingobium sp. Fuku2-ISO-50]
MRLLLDTHVLIWWLAGDEALSRRAHCNRVGFIGNGLAGEMNITHKDPFDRVLIAQALAEGMRLVSNEALFDSFAVQRLW